MPSCLRAERAEDGRWLRNAKGGMRGITRTRTTAVVLRPACIPFAARGSRRTLPQSGTSHACKIGRTVSGRPENDDALVLEGAAHSVNVVNSKRQMAEVARWHYSGRILPTPVPRQLQLWLAWSRR